MEMISIITAVTGIAISALALFLVYRYNHLSEYENDKFVENMQQVLIKSGYKASMQNGLLVVDLQDNVRFGLQLNDTIDKRVKELYIVHDFVVPDLEKVRWELISALLAIENSSQKSWLVQREDNDEISAVIFTAISNPKHVKDIFQSAAENIVDTVSDFLERYEANKEDFPQTDEDKKIGYV